MSLGQGLGQGLMLGAQLVNQNRRADKAEKRQLEMFNLKRVADIEDFQKMEEIKDNLTDKKRQRTLNLLTTKYGNNNAIPQPNTAIPISGPISGNGAVPLPLPIPSSPAQGQVNMAQPQVAPKAPTAMFNRKAWQQQHFEDYIDSETGAFDEKGFRKGAEEAQKENATLQYLRANNLDVPEGVNLGTLSPFIGSMLGEKKETKKLEYKTQGNKIAQKILTDPGYRTGKKQLTDFELEALAKGGINIDSLYRSDGSLDVANATEAARIIATNMKPQQIAVSLRPPKVGRSGGGHGRSGGGSVGGKPMKRFNPETNSYDFYDSKTGQPVGQASRPAPVFNYNPQLPKR